METIYYPRHWVQLTTTHESFGKAWFMGICWSFFMHSQKQSAQLAVEWTQITGA
jgi:hypothetical protein